MERWVSYIIASTPRSGGSLLGAALLQTGVAGKPQEYFHVPIQEEFLYRKKFGIQTLGGYVQGILNEAETPNGVRGFKLHAFQTANFLAKTEDSFGASLGTLKEAIDAVMPNTRYIWMTRNDTLAQAASYYRALMTNEWWRFPGAGAPSRDAGVAFDQLAISYCELLIRASDAYWAEYFNHHAITPLHITFENITVNYESSVRSALTFLDLPEETRIPPPATVKMSDRRSELWINELRGKKPMYTEADVERLKHRWAPI